jgi:hypothetical protein
MAVGAFVPVTSINIGGFNDFFHELDIIVPDL